jgi:hypothetical protein
MSRQSFFGVLCGLALLILLPSQAEARIKLAALPDRADTVIRLDHPAATLIEEERVLTLQKGLNHVDFSWKGVSIDADSIRLKVLTQTDKVALLSLSYPPEEASLVWEMHAKEAVEVAVRISYLLSNIDRLIAYRGVANLDETQLQLRSFLVLRNFSGEDFDQATIFLSSSQFFPEQIQNEETKQILLFTKPAVPIRKVWTFDAGQLPWDPEKLESNVGIPVVYRLENVPKAGLGAFGLWKGKVRVFQEDGHQGTIFLGEDQTQMVPVGERMEIYIGDSRDLVVTQRKMREERVNVRRNKKGQIVLYDTDELIQARLENFKDRAARLTLIQHVLGEWNMEDCNLEYRRRDANTLEFEVDLAPHSHRELVMHYHRRNVR